MPAGRSDRNKHRVHGHTIWRFISIGFVLKSNTFQLAFLYLSFLFDSKW